MEWFLRFWAELLKDNRSTWEVNELKAALDYLAVGKQESSVLILHCTD